MFSFSAIPTTGLSDLLTVLIEECSEVQKAATKLQRFGAGVGAPGSKTTNLDDLLEELSHLDGAITLILQRLGVGRNMTGMLAHIRKIELYQKEREEWLRERNTD